MIYAQESHERRSSVQCIELPSHTGSSGERTGPVTGWPVARQGGPDGTAMAKRAVGLSSSRIRRKLGLPKRILRASAVYNWHHCGDDRTCAHPFKKNDRACQFSIWRRGAYTSCRVFSRNRRYCYNTFSESEFVSVNYASTSRKPRPEYTYSHGSKSNTFSY